MKLLLLCLCVAVAHGDLAPIYMAKERGIPNSFIIKIKDASLVDQVADEIQNQFVKMRFPTPIMTKIRLVMPAITIRIPPNLVNDIRSLDGIEYIEQDSLGQPAVYQDNPSWGLDRIDDRNGLDNMFYLRDDAIDMSAKVNIYVLDTGIQENHSDFGGRVTTLYGSVDDWGHGTHCAGTAAGATFGIARKARIFSAKVCELSGCPISQFTKACEAVLKHGTQGVVSISIKYYASPSIDNDVQGLLDKGLVVSVAAGNDNDDACTISPQRVKDAITVGATDKNDQRAYFSNWGSCVDIFAPGTNILSAGLSDQSIYETAVMSGTSMACPHVTGVAALYIGINLHVPNEVITDLVLMDATKDKVKDTRGSPNLLLYSGGA